MTSGAAQPNRRARTHALAWLVGLSAMLPAQALRLGEPAVHSALGEPLNATFLLAIAPGETLGPDCFRLGRARATGLLAESRATFAVETAGAATRLRLRTAVPVHEPALQIRINAACPGGRASTRDYELLLDPRVTIAPPTIRAPAEVAVPAGPARGTLPGDSLASIAAAIYPGDPATQERYVEALRRENPSLADVDAAAALPPGTPLRLPDLREFSRRLPPTTSPAAKPSAAASPRARPSAPAPVRPQATARKAPPPRPDTPAVRIVAPAPVIAPGPGVSLRLSTPELDLSRSRGMDARSREQLRERLRAVHADDRMAALLALQNNLRQLEGRLAELQLKLTDSTPSPAPAATPSPARPAAPSPAVPAQPTPAPAPAAPPEKPAAPQPAAPAQAVQAAPAKPAEAAPPKPAETAPAKKVGEPVAKLPAKTPPPSPEDELPFGLPAWLWGIAAAAVALLGLVAYIAWRRRARAAAPAEEPVEPSPGGLSDLDEAEARMRGEPEEPMPPSLESGRVVAESDAALTTRVGGADPAALRRRYIEERFPEIAAGSVVLDDADSIVKAARLFYEDGALPRAVELLQFAAEEQPADERPWLALFEIFRLESLAGEFGALAERFREHHGRSGNWPKVQFIGRELDPQNPLYHDAPRAELETIVPLTAAAAPVTFDPMAENWLNAPMDFTSDALGPALRAALLGDAGVRDEDLAFDPMPALKSIEMFNVA